MFFINFKLLVTFCQGKVRQCFHDKPKHMKRTQLYTQGNVNLRKGYKLRSVLSLTEWIV